MSQQSQWLTPNALAFDFTFTFLKIASLCHFWRCLVKSVLFPLSWYMEHSTEQRLSPLVLATASHLSGFPTCSISITPDELSILVPLSSNIATLQHAKTRFHRGTLVSLTSCLRLVADYLPFSRISLLPSVLTTSNFSEVSLRNFFLLTQFVVNDSSLFTPWKGKHILPEI